MIEVPIDPEGGETSYEIWLECGSTQNGNQSCEPLTDDPQRVQGVLAAGFEQQIVIDQLTDLQPGYLYKYGVIATNSAGSGGWHGNGFWTCLSEISCGEPYMPGLSLRVIEAEQASAAETVREQQAKEAAEAKAAEEAAPKRHEEEKETSPVQARTYCVVPYLRGDTLHVARRRLAAAHCSLGAVRRPRDEGGPLVVARQAPHRGVRRKDGTRVALTLGSR